MISFLSKNWFFEDAIDFELKKYTLLSYLQYVDVFYNEKKLYSCFADVQSHYNNLIYLRNQKRNLQQNFHSELTGIDVEKLELTYDQVDDKKLGELYEIMDYAIAQFEAPIRTGNEMFKEVAYRLKIEPVGIVPVRKDEGYLLVSDNAQPGIWVYTYRNFVIQEINNRISTQFLTIFDKTVENTYENIKLQLIRNNPTIPNPAVYSLRFNTAVFPFEETLIPIGKRKVLEQLKS